MALGRLQKIEFQTHMGLLTVLKFALSSGEIPVLCYIGLSTWLITTWQLHSPECVRETHTLRQKRIQPHWRGRDYKRHKHQETEGTGNHLRNCFSRIYSFASKPCMTFHGRYLPYFIYPFLYHWPSLSPVPHYTKVLMNCRVDVLLQIRVPLAYIIRTGNDEP